MAFITTCWALNTKHTISNYSFTIRHNKFVIHREGLLSDLKSGNREVLADEPLNDIAMDKLINHYLHKHNSPNSSVHRGYLLPDHSPAAVIAVSDSESFAIIFKNGQSEPSIHEFKYEHVHSFTTESSSFSKNGNGHTLNIHFIDGASIEIGSTSFPQKAFKILDNENFLRSQTQKLQPFAHQLEIINRLKNAGALLEKGYLKDAAKEYHRVLDMDSLNLAGYLGLIHAQIRLNNSDISDKLITRVFALFPNQTTTIRKQVAEMYSGVKAPDKAQKYFEPVFQDNPTQNYFTTYAGYSLAANEKQGLILLANHLQDFPGTFNHLVSKGITTEEQAPRLLEHTKEVFAHPEQHEHVIFIQSQSKSNAHNDTAKRWMAAIGIINSDSTKTLTEAIQILKESQPLFSKMEQAVVFILKEEHKEKIQQSEILHKQILLCHNTLTKNEAFTQSLISWFKPHKGVVLALDTNSPKEVRGGFKILWPLLKTGQQLSEEGKPLLDEQVRTLISKRHYNKAKKLNNSILELFDSTEPNQELAKQIVKKLRLRKVIWSLVSIIILGLAGFFGFKAWEEYQLFEQDKILYAQTYPEGRYIEEAADLYLESIQFPAFTSLTDDLYIRRSSSSRGDILSTLSVGDTVFWLNRIDSRKHRYRINGDVTTDYYYEVSPTKPTNNNYNPKQGWVYGGGLNKNLLIPYEQFKTYLEIFPNGKDSASVNLQFEQLKHLIEAFPITINNNSLAYIEKYPEGKYVPKIDSLLWESIPVPILKCNVRKTYLHKEPNAKSKTTRSFRNLQRVYYLMERSQRPATVEIDKEPFTDYFYKVSKYENGEEPEWAHGGAVEPAYRKTIEKCEEYLSLLPNGLFRLEVEQKLNALKRESGFDNNNDVAQTAQPQKTSN